jgi:hypothetical protein
MNTEHSKAGSNHNSKGHSPKGGVKATDFVSRATATVTGFPSWLDAKMTHNPYVALGVAGAVGTAVGIVLSSRILRAVLTATATAGALELARAFVRERVAEAHRS